MKSWSMERRRARFICTAWFFYVVFIAMIASLLNQDNFLNKNDDAYFHHGFIEDLHSIPSLARWDSIWYFEIAKEGYTGQLPDDKYTAGFYPLYSAAMRVAHEVTTLDYFICGILLSMLFLLGFLICFDLYLRQILGYQEREADAALLLFLAFPTTFICITAYASSLFCLLAVAAFLCLKLKRIGLATLFAFLLGLTHMHSLTVLVGICYLAWRTRNKKYWIPAAGVFVANVALMLYFHFQFGDALAYLHAKKYFSSGLNGPIAFLMHMPELTSQLIATPNIPTFIRMCTLSIFVLVAATLVEALRAQAKRQPFEIAYVASMCLIQIATGMTWGFARFALNLFPIFGWWAVRLSRQQVWLASAIGFSAFLQMLHLYHWITAVPPAP
jgi:hypothetical protein